MQTCESVWVTEQRRIFFSFSVLRIPSETRYLLLNGSILGKEIIKSIMPERFINKMANL
jgi:hypothetical protein